MNSSYIEFEVNEIKCGTASPSALIKRLGAIIIIEGTINVPDPCYALKFSTEEDQKNKELVINITAFKKKVICIKCLARIKFTIKINTMPLKQIFQSKEAKINIIYRIRGKEEKLLSEIVSLG